MRIAVFGLGYVGAITGACLARDGHHVIGVDLSDAKVDAINAGRAPVEERDLASLTRAAVEAGRLRATRDAAEAVAASEMSLICVGTPGKRNGALDPSAVVAVARDIGATLASRDAPHVVVVRSTVLPGTTRDLVAPALEAAAGRSLGGGLSLAFNPEFLREGCAVSDYDSPPKIVVGSDDRAAVAAVAGIYRGIDAELIVTSLDTAEMVKYADNAWHAVKVAFGNEMGSIAKSAGVDSRQLMDVFCRDRKLNISPAYLRPGFAFGGSCLPKDLRALAYKAREGDVATPLLASVLASNEALVARTFERIADAGARRIGFCGIAFKAGTDDLRESPQVDLVERLIGKGFDLRIYDPDVRMSRLQGANLAQVMDRVPHLSALLEDDLSHVVDHAELVVLGNSAPEYRAVPGMLRSDQRLLDLARAADPGALGARYEGVTW